jgi:hypothetical protein
LSSGSDNGGATAQGVTADAIKVVFLDNGATPGVCYMYWCQVVDAAGIFQRFYQTYGRTVQLVRVTPSGSDETAQRADAIRIAEMKPFAVLAEFAGRVLVTELLKRQIIVSAYQADAAAAKAYPPYAWGVGTDIFGQAIAVAEFAAKGLAGHPAKWAGDSTMQKTARKFGVILPNNIDQNLVLDTFTASGGPRPTIFPYDYSSATGITANPAYYQQQAPLLAVKLKTAGINNVIAFTDPTFTAYLTKAATQQEFFPEWTVTGFQFQDVDIFGVSYDQKQWAHAFGLGQTEPRENGVFGPAPYRLYQWYYGKTVHQNNDPNNRNMDGNIGRNGVSLHQISQLFIGVQLAGPKLTPTTYRDGLFAFPPSGGAASGFVTWPQLSFGSHGLYPWDDYQSWDDYAMVWWNPSVSGLSNSGVDLTVSGKYMYANGGKRFTPSHFPKSEPPMFEPSGAVAAFNGVPSSDQFPNYPCTGCPGSK